MQFYDIIKSLTDEDVICFLYEKLLQWGVSGDKPDHLSLLFKVRLVQCE